MEEKGFRQEISDRAKFICQYWDCGMTGKITTNSRRELKFFFFLDSICLISLRLCGTSVPSPLKVWYTHGKTGYINVLLYDSTKCTRKYPSSAAATSATGPSPIKVFLLYYTTSSPSAYIYDSSTSTPLTGLP